jgi:hypothetical protein
MNCIQSRPDPNPGAVTSFIAMEDVPGKVYDWAGFWSGTTLWERVQKRAAFKEAYQYVYIPEKSFNLTAYTSSDCFRCGYWNLDAGLRNLIFDDVNDKWLVLYHLTT